MTARRLEEYTVLDAFQRHEHFAKALLDAFAVVDNSGRVVKANQFFTQLTGKKGRQILKANSFDDLLSLSIDGKELSITDILKFSTPTRIDEVRGVSKNSSSVLKNEELNLILGVYPFVHGSNSDNVLGAFILIRDVTAETNLQDKYKHTAIKSITDPLTGLFTRAYFEDYLDLQVSAITALEDEGETEIPDISLIMVDIDFFKKVNDVYGHQAGDYVLKVVGSLMKREFRKTDVVCRYGGEEFLVILPGADYKNAGSAANKLRRSIEKEKVYFEGIHIPITVSCGVGMLNHNHETYKETMARADAALYESKRKGRNLVSIHDGNEIISVVRR